MTTITYTRVRYGKTETVTRAKNAHGESRTALHNVWKGMKERCHNPKADNYKFYGARGIEVCPLWRTDYEAFRDWARAAGYESGMQIDRIDNTQGYRPDNCRWVTRTQNLKNRRQYLPTDVEERLTALAKERGVEVYLLIRTAVEEFLAAEHGKEVS